MTVKRPRTDVWALLIVVGVIAALHDTFATRSVLLHEIFKRLYYLPIAYAGVRYGAKGGVGFAVLSAAVYLPHVVLGWHMVPILEAEQYGEAIVFLLVGCATGLLADRVHRERNRYRQAVEELQRAYADLQAQTNERLHVDRLVTTGRIAAGMADQIRNPLGALVGCIEILDDEIGATDPKREFLAIARHEVGRLNGVLKAFLDFASPPPPTASVVRVVDVVQGAARLANVTLGGEYVTVRAGADEERLELPLDAEQLQQSLLNLVLDGVDPRGPCDIAIEMQREGGGDVVVVVDLGQVSSASAIVADQLEPFPPSGRGDGLSAALARRLIENQGGHVDAANVAGRLQYRITLPGPPSRMLTPPVSEIAQRRSQNTQGQALAL